MQFGLCEEYDCRVISAVREKFKPEVIVCQCGTDGVVGDPLASFNLTPQGLAHCVQYLMDFNLPLVLLGGGSCLSEYSLDYHCDIYRVAKKVSCSLLLNKFVY